MTARLLDRLRGTVLIELRGADLERFLTLCARRGTGFRRICWIDETCFTAWISADRFFRIGGIARRCGCRVTVLKKSGIPFDAHRLSRRWMLCLGLLLSVLAVWYLSGCIWTIRVEGGEPGTRQQILTLLEQNGVRTGTRRSSIRVKELKNTVLQADDKLLYFTLNFSGTQAIVQVWERKDQAEKPEMQPPCNVISQYAGVVEAIRVRTGKALVKAGDGVAAGDMIATGVVVNEHDETDSTLLHARAEADVRFTRTLTAVIPSELWMKEGTGQVQRQNSLQLGRSRFPLGIIEKNRFLWYDKQIKRSELKLREDFRWPMARILVETADVSVVRSHPEQKKLEAEMQDRLLRILESQIPGCRILQTAFSLKKSGSGAWQGTLKAELVVTTGLEVPME